MPLVGIPSERGGGSENVSCLQDSEDDVCAVSAEAMLPVAHLLAHQSGDVIDSLTTALWDALLEVDELNPATGDH